MANAVAGTALTYMRPFRVGDVVAIGEGLGRITEATTLATRLRTPKNVEIRLAPGREPFVNQRALGEFAVECELDVWVAAAAGGRSQGALAPGARARPE